MSERHPAARRARLVLALTLVGATVLLAGCGDSAHLPAGTASSSLGSSGGDALSSVLGTDPGSELSATSSNLVDPVLDDYSGIDDMAAMGDDMWATAANDFNDDMGGLSTVGLDDALYDDPYETVGYGYGGYGDGGWGTTLGTANLYNSYGYGNGVGMASYGAAAFDGGIGGYGGELIDPTLGDATMDPMFDDLGGSIDDPSVGIGAADTSIDDGGFGGMDFGSPVDFGGADFGGPVDFGGADIGGFDAAPIDVGGFDTGGFDAAPVDVGGFDTGGFDIGAGVMDIGGMDAGIGF